MADINARLRELVEMKKEGMLTDEEFASAKARVLAAPASGLAAHAQVEESFGRREARVCGSSQRRWLLAGLTLLAVIGALATVLAIVLPGQNSVAGVAGNYLVLVGPYTFDDARDACSETNMRLASFSTRPEATAAQAAVAAADVSKAWTAAWRDMHRKTWGWYGYDGGAVEVRVEWHVFDGGSAGCYMAALEDCDPTSHPYATDCYTCENIDVESTRHGFSLSAGGDMDMDMVSEQHPALCMKGQGVLFAASPGEVPLTSDGPTLQPEAADHMHSRGVAGNYSVLVGPYTFDDARDACSEANMRLASFSTRPEATAAQAAVAAADVSKAWTAAWRDMHRKTWGWYGYDGGAVEVRVEWHVFDGGSAGCYMAALEDCDPTSHPYATDCYTCENIDVESTRHGFSLSAGGGMDMDMVSEQHPALCMAL